MFSATTYKNTFQLTSFVTLFWIYSMPLHVFFNSGCKISLQVYVDSCTEHWSWNHICHLYGAWDLWILSLFMFKCSIKWSSGSRLSKNSIFCLHLRDSSLLSSFLLPWKWKKPLSFWKFSVFWNRMLYVYNFHLFDKTILLIPQYPQYGPSDTKLLTNTDTSS